MMNTLSILRSGIPGKGITGSQGMPRSLQEYHRQVFSRAVLSIYNPNTSRSTSSGCSHPPPHLTFFLLHGSHSGRCLTIYCTVFLSCISSITVKIGYHFICLLASWVSILWGAFSSLLPIFLLLQMFFSQTQGKRRSLHIWI